MSRGRGKTVLIRVYAEDRDTYNKWCIKKGCDMPDLHRLMIEYGIRKQDQMFYSLLPKPTKYANPVIRRVKSKINRNCIQ